MGLKDRFLFKGMWNRVALNPTEAYMADVEKAKTRGNDTIPTPTEVAAIMAPNTVSVNQVLYAIGHVLKNQQRAMEKFTGGHAHFEATVYLNDHEIVMVEKTLEQAGWVVLSGSNDQALRRYTFHIAFPDDV